MGEKKNPPLKQRLVKLIKPERRFEEEETASTCMVNLKKSEPQMNVTLQLFFAYLSSYFSSWVHLGADLDEGCSSVQVSQ